MTDGPVAALAAFYTTAAAPAGMVPTPTAAQIARFQDQLQLPLPQGEVVARYDAPSPAAPVAQGHFTHLLDYAGRVSEQLRTQLDRPDRLTIDPKLSPELRLMQEMSHELRSVSLLELQFHLMGKGLQMAARNVQVLYQQQG